MLYTIVPLDAVFPEDTPEPEYHTVSGIIVEYRRAQNGRPSACRMITSDLRRYLPE